MTPEENKNMKDCTTCKYGFVDEQSGFPMCHHPLRFSEDCVDFNMHEEVEESEKATGIEEKKLPEGLDEAAVQAHIRLEESEKLSFFNVFKAALQARIRLEESDELSFFNLFKAGAEWMAKQMEDNK